MTDLLSLLRRIRDGHATVDEVARARALIRDDVRLDDELRSIALTDDDLSGDAAGLLAVLGADDLGSLLADAIVHEAGTIAAEAIDQTVLATLDWRLGPDLAAAVIREAGPVDVVDGVLDELGLTDAFARGRLGRALIAEAGPIDVADAVMAEIAATMPSAIHDLPPANDTRAFVAISGLLAAAAFVFVSLVGLQPADDALPALAFANADEVVIEDLTSDADVLMLQGPGQDGALILWFDEET